MAGIAWMRRMTWWVWLAAGAGLVPALSVLAAQPATQVRPTLSLDGTWQFRADPADRGEKEEWFRGKTTFDRTIRVPGAWGAQGVGEPTDKVRHHYVGKAWYLRRVTVPPAWAQKRVILTVGGVHRYATVYVNGRRLGEHVGYLSPFEFDLTPHVRPGQEAVIAIRVDSQQRWDVDALTGAMDIIDAMFVPWGGISGHVALEARGPLWLEDLYVQPSVDPPACRVSAGLAGRLPSSSQKLRSVLEVLDAQGRVVSEAEGEMVGKFQPGSPKPPVLLDAKLPGARLWTPASPALYTARLTLQSGDVTLDQVQTRFGLREIRVDGPAILLNGKRIFLHGCGDDSVYPRTVSPPTDKASYLKRLRVLKAYGFNHVRHHSHFLPDEYYDACDEIGVLVSPELPIAYMSYFQRAKGKALDLYASEWAAAIIRHRNHPSILDWCMGNEFWHGLPIATRLYGIARKLDPTRPIVDSDGLFAREILSGRSDRPTLDLWFTMFQVHHLPLDRPDKHTFARPAKPVISHETGNYGTFPRLDLIERFEHNFKPFWLTPVRAKLEKLHLLDEAERWAANSERLYLLCHKLNIEDLRRNPYASGHHWWLMQDYWTGCNGIVDAYYRPKPPVPTDRVRQFNADVVLLQDGLPLTGRAGDELSVKLLVSNYSPSAIRRGRLTWQWSAEPEGASVLPGARGGQVSVTAPQGVVAQVGLIGGKIPSLPSGPTAPVRLRLSLDLVAGEIRQTNAWSTWVYPQKISPPALTAPLYAGPVVLRGLQAMGAKPLPAAEPLPARAVYVMRQPTPPVVDAVRRGAALVLLTPRGLLPTVRTRFKTSWWLGSATDCNVGTVAYDHSVTRATAPEGWCDSGWYRLLEGATTFVLDDLALAGKSPNVLLRALDVHRFCRSKALLFQGRVGKGALIVSGLRLAATQANRPPEAQWLLTQLIAYAGSFPTPAPAFPANRLADCAQVFAPPPGPYLAGFAQLVGATEKGRWHSYRGDSEPFLICRQTALGNRVEWDTAAVTGSGKGETVTFVFAGGLGWVDQPKTPGFALRLDGKETLRFDVTQNAALWKSPDGAVRLRFLPHRRLPLDGVGLFYLTVPRGRLAPGKPLRVAVTSLGQGSRRWFGVNEYKDLVDKP